MSSYGTDIRVTRAPNLYYKFQKIKYSPNKLSYFDRLAYLQNNSNQVTYNSNARGYERDNRNVLKKVKARYGNTLVIQARRLPLAIVR